MSAFQRLRQTLVLSAALAVTGSAFAAQANLTSSDPADRAEYLVSTLGQGNHAVLTLIGLNAPSDEKGKEKFIDKLAGTNPNRQLIKDLVNGCITLKNETQTRINRGEINESISVSVDYAEKFSNLNQLLVTILKSGAFNYQDVIGFKNDSIFELVISDTVLLGKYHLMEYRQAQEEARYDDAASIKNKFLQIRINELTHNNPTAAPEILRAQILTEFEGYIALDTAIEGIVVDGLDNQDISNDGQRSSNQSLSARQALNNSNEVHRLMTGREYTSNYQLGGQALDQSVQAQSNRAQSHESPALLKLKGAHNALQEIISKEIGTKLISSTDLPSVPPADMLHLQGVRVSFVGTGLIV